MILKQRVPQGSVQSTHFFLLCIEGQASDVGATQVGLFADDVTVWTQDTDLERATSKLQKGLDAVAIWSTTWKMTLSAQKSQCSFFTTNTHEAR